MISLYFLSAFIVSLVVVYICRKIAIKINFVDNPNTRKVQTEPKALLGGLAIFISTLIMYLIYSDGTLNTDIIMIILLGGGLVLLGTIDDKYDLSPLVKLFFQFLISITAAYVLGGLSSIEIYKFTIYFTELMGIIIQAFWIMVLINAFNLIDGLDGLASGMGIISLVTLFLVAVMTNDSSSLVLIVILIGILLGFLFYNFYPSTIFLGDAGSMYIGYLIAIISIGNYKTVTLTASILIFLIAFLPILDATLSFIRRKKNGEKAFRADALHFHHRLMLHGYSHQVSVLILYLFMSMYAMIAIVISLGDFRFKVISMVLALILTVFIIEKFYLLSDNHAYVSRIFKRVFKGGR